MPIYNEKQCFSTAKTVRGAVSFDNRFTKRIEPEAARLIGDLERGPGVAKGKRGAKRGGKP
jgi:hypothetical protein